MFNLMQVMKIEIEAENADNSRAVEDILFHSFLTVLFVVGDKVTLIQ